MAQMMRHQSAIAGLSILWQPPRQVTDAVTFWFGRTSCLQPSGNSRGSIR
ncbi:hypothetical protein I4641_13720 [Waterburya agarophytonicola K14]|uniref:Uncharacterized protein n=1 Tax=Waterburya agarophytonicola KI4 TaxID=2874699 RepID=A0A964BQZ3_9CYAN|nr:hypothetical protein [Waterburya agarophytonicola]MCC0178038.1 hypothetical protein [Waterburya agarophytonicola KI4]